MKNSLFILVFVIFCSEAYALPQNWPKLYRAIANRDVNGIVNNVHRKDVGLDRNDWAKRMAHSIRF